MVPKVARLFTVKNRLEAYMIIYALALGATSRGVDYQERYPGIGGWLLFFACMGAVVLGGAKMLDCLRMERAALAAEPSHAAQDSVPR
jgi:hypothetical protein